MLRGIKDEGDLIGTFMEARCDRGAEIAHMVFLSEGTAAAIRSLDEAVRVAKQRRGRWFDPELVDAFLRFRGDRAFWAALDAPDVSAWEPPDSILTGDDARLDRIAEAFARVIDAKSPFTARHSERVAELAAGIGSELGFDRDEVRPLRRAGLLHDIGKLAISNLILDKPGRLGEEEFAVIQTHPVQTLRILERAPCFAPLADVAANHHEKLDGTGYPRGLDATSLDLPMRVLAVADIYEALTAQRPYRPALDPEQALAIIDRDVPERPDPRARAALESHVASPHQMYPTDQPLMRP